jgi:hypothetical protein
MFLQSDDGAHVSSSTVPKSEVNGVCWCSSRNKWQVFFHKNGSRTFLGQFENEDAAIAARKAAEAQHGVPQVGGRRIWKYITEEEKRAARLAKYRAYGIRNREALRLKHKDRAKKKKLADPIGSMLVDAKRRAKQRGIEFTLDSSKLTIPEHCEVCGVTMKLFSGIKFKSDAVSLDRLDNAKGYIDGNVRFICLDCNRWKSDCTESWRFRAIADYMDRNLAHKH